MSASPFSETGQTQECQDARPQWKGNDSFNELIQGPGGVVSMNWVHEKYENKIVPKTSFFGGAMKKMDDPFFLIWLASLQNRTGMGLGGLGVTGPMVLVLFHKFMTYAVWW